MRHLRLAGVAVAALTVLPVIAGAQKPTRRRQAPIEIKGQVPTPQVVTVRPREVPTYSRQVLVPRFFDHDFWPDIQTGYLMVPQRQITGHSVSDTLGATVDTSAAGGVMAAPQRLAPTTPSTTTNPGGTPPSTSPMTPMTTSPSTSPSTTPGTTPGASPARPTTPDTTRRQPGTASAPPAR